MTAAIKRLSVIYEGHGESFPLGVLVQFDERHQRLGFEYSPRAIAWSQAHGVEFSGLYYPIPKSSHASPFTNGPAHFGFLPGFIADALPDGWGMLLMDRALRKQGRDPRSVGMLDRLAMVGRCALGALSFEPIDDLGLGQPIDKELSLLTISQEIQVLLEDHAQTTPLEQLQHLLVIGGSPQGARPKALLRLRQIQTPHGGTQSDVFSSDSAGLKAGQPWLIKFPAQGEHPEVSAIEELYARLARQGGIDMPATRLFVWGDGARDVALEMKRRVGAGAASAFAVQRFDRVSAGVSEHRVPMQSLAAFVQSDYRLPALDYETLMQATWRMTGDQREVEKAFHRCVFNVLAHNRDDHAKNFAFVLDATHRWKLSPAFDLTYSFGPGAEHCTSVSGEGRNPNREHLVRVATKGNLSAAFAHQTIDHWIDVLNSGQAQQQHQDLPIRASTWQTLSEQLAQQSKRLRLT